MHEFLSLALAKYNHLPLTERQEIAWQSLLACENLESWSVVVSASKRDKKKNCSSISQEPVRNTTKSYLLFVPINPVDVEIFHRIRKMFGLLVELGEK